MSHHLLTRLRKLVYSLRPVLVTALTASLLACGGGRSDSQSPGLQGQTNTTKNAIASQSTTAIPLDTDQACTQDSEYIASTDPELTLLSRHVDCRTVASDFSQLEVYADLFENANGTFRYATLQEIDDRVPQYTSVVVGRFTKIEAQIALYGASNVLSKNYKIRMRGLGFTRDPDYRGPSTSSEGIEVRFRLTCSGQNSASTCTYPQSKFSVSTSGQWTDAPADIAVAFNWPAPEAGQNDLETFSLNTDRLYFHAKGSVDRGDDNGSANYFGLDNSAVQVRCDRNVAEQGTEGCVLPLAAPVYVLRTSDPAVSEAAEHIREAQANGSPGKFLMKAGTRAVADAMVSSAGTALQRLKNADDLTPGSPNRTAACLRSNANSLINIRPSQYSNSCMPTTPGGTPQPGCQCDEYPFNASYQGAAYLPDVTSVKWINGVQNNNAGGVTFKNWYNRERVLDLGSDRQSGLPSAGSSDYFWVHVPLAD